MPPNRLQIFLSTKPRKSTRPDPKHIHALEKEDLSFQRVGNFFLVFKHVCFGGEGNPVTLAFVNCTPNSSTNQFGVTLR